MDKYTLEEKIIISTRTINVEIGKKVRVVLKLQIHEVKKGENLSSIAQQYNTTYQEITSINKILNPNLIYPQQKLIIPQEDKEKELNKIKLNGTMIPLGTKINVVAKGTRGSTATIKILVKDSIFEFLKDNQNITQFDVTFDEN
ncbi:LysM peptidoglycan-binding domain-containing protein [Arcobacter sp. YIC-310]|uniref:LysM peptidoglycan-binding domain-containing protein n=1 Tax=Arcobacter sp. YIC-310 TaxID=3376632 RepID=UPI003C29A4BF